MKRSKDSSQTKRPVPSGRFRITFAHLLLVLSGMLLMALVQTVFLRPAFSGRKQRPGSQPGAQAQTTNAPWGAVDYTPLALDRPSDYFTNGVQREKTAWTFHLADHELVGLFRSLDLDADSQSFLTERSNWQPHPSGFRIIPPPAVVVNLKPETREKLYDVLARWPENGPQRMPFLFNADGFERWFDACGLSSNRLDMVRRMTYRREGSLCFADAAICSEMWTPAETMCLVHALWRVPTFVMSVRVAPGMDVEKVVQYWGKAGRAAAYRPMLEAMSRVDAGPVPISYFFPTFARMRLYTYPAPNDPQAAREDCFWTAMNFFNETPEERFFDGHETSRALQQDYTRQRMEDREFGDIILLLGPGGKALHMCVYIADNVVFTKNGFATAQPWVLMKLDEMLGSYRLERPFELNLYRRKVIPQASAMSVSAVRH